MNRKEFLKNACRISVASGAAFLITETDGSGSLPSAQEEQSMNRREKFAQDWVRALMTGMDNQLEEGTRVKLMESSGRACARRGAIKAALECKGDLDQFLATMKKWVGAENVHRNGKKVQLVYSKCLCPLVQSGSERLSDTYCNCSRGWVKEMFEAVCEREVGVELTESIKRGGKVCRFIVQV